MEFLDDMENGSFVNPPTEKELIQNQKENEKMTKKEEKQKEQERKRLEK